MAESVPEDLTAITIEETSKCIVIGDSEYYYKACETVQQLVSFLESQAKATTVAFIKIEKGAAPLPALVKPPASVAVPPLAVAPVKGALPPKLPSQPAVAPVPQPIAAVAQAPAGGSSIIRRPLPTPTTPKIGGSMRALPPVTPPTPTPAAVPPPPIVAPVAAAVPPPPLTSPLTSPRTPGGIPPPIASVSPAPSPAPPPIISSPTPPVYSKPPAPLTASTGSAGGLPAPIRAGLPKNTAAKSTSVLSSAPLPRPLTSSATDTRPKSNSFFDELEDEGSSTPAAPLPAVPTAAVAKNAPVVFAATKAISSTSATPAAGTGGRPPTRPMGPSRGAPAPAAKPAAPKAPSSLSSTINAMKTAQGVEEDEEPDLDLKVMTYGKFDKAVGPGARRLPSKGYRKHVEEVTKRSKRIEYRYKFFVREKEKSKEEQRKMIEQIDEEHLAAERKRIEEQNKMTESLYAPKNTELGGGDDAEEKKEEGGGLSLFNTDLNSFLAAAEETEKKKKPAEDILDELDSLIGDEDTASVGASSFPGDDDFALKSRARKNNRLTLMLKDFDGLDDGARKSFDPSALTMDDGPSDAKLNDINEAREALRLETERLRAELEQARRGRGGGY